MIKYLKKKKAASSRRVEILQVNFRCDKLGVQEFFSQPTNRDHGDSHMVVSKNRGKTPKMDGENNGKPYE